MTLFLFLFWLLTVACGLQGRRGECHYDFSRPNEVLKGKKRKRKQSCVLVPTTVVQEDLQIDSSELRPTGIPSFLNIAYPKNTLDADSTPQYDDRLELSLQFAASKVDDYVQWRTYCYS